MSEHNVLKKKKKPKQKNPSLKKPLSKQQLAAYNKAERSLIVFELKINVHGKAAFIYCIIINLIKR